MTHATILFSRSRTLGSLLIRSATWSRWSHVCLATPDGTAIEATAAHGVQEVDVYDVIDRSSMVALGRVWCPDVPAAIAWARRQVGKPYDYFGALGLGLHREWQQDDKWWCSELVEAALAKGGNLRFRHDLQRVTPQHSWMVTPNGYAT